jgi:hypothetical protein
MDGKQQHTYQYDSNKHRLFTVPYRITTNNNKDIVVVDITSPDTGRVVVVGTKISSVLILLSVGVRIPGSLTPTIILLSLVTWIPQGLKGDTEKNGFISPDKSAWVHNGNQQVIRQINIDNDIITTTKQISCG